MNLVFQTFKLKRLLVRILSWLISRCNGLVRIEHFLENFQFVANVLLLVEPEDLVDLGKGLVELGNLFVEQTVALLQLLRPLQQSVVLLVLFAWLLLLAQVVVLLL